MAMIRCATCSLDNSKAIIRSLPFVRPSKASASFSNSTISSKLFSSPSQRSCVFLGFLNIQCPGSSPNNSRTSAKSNKNLLISRANSLLLGFFPPFHPTYSPLIATSSPLPDTLSLSASACTRLPIHPTMPHYPSPCPVLLLPTAAAPTSA